jgi:hypothetical protein
MAFGCGIRTVRNSESCPNADDICRFYVEPAMDRASTLWAQDAQCRQQKVPEYLSAVLGKT